MITRPMLAATVKNVSEIRFPVACTPKLDGIRCLILGGKALTRKFKEIPNRHIRSVLESLPIEGFDGEIMVPNAGFNDIQSHVMSRDGTPEFEYWVFDCVRQDLQQPYMQRIADLAAAKAPQFVRKLSPTICNNVQELEALEQSYIDQGFEGIIIRSLDGPYKCNRSTLREGYLLKLKRFLDAEGVIVGFEERMHNDNVAEKDELGHTKRSSSKDNMIPTGMLGAVVVKTPEGIEFSIGTGFDDSLRQKIWDDQQDYLGKVVKYKYQPSGVKEKPRFPVYLGIRAEEEI